MTRALLLRALDHALRPLCDARHPLLDSERKGWPAVYRIRRALERVIDAGEWAEERLRRVPWAKPPQGAS